METDRLIGYGSTGIQYVNRDNKLTLTKAEYQHVSSNLPLALSGIKKFNITYNTNGGCDHMA